MKINKKNLIIDLVLGIVIIIVLTIENVHSLWVFAIAGFLTGVAFPWIEEEEKDEKEN